MAGGKAELAHELLDRRSVLGDGSPVDPVVDVDEPVGEIRVEALDFFVAVVVDILMLAVRRDDGVLVHQLIEHVTPPSGKIVYVHYTAPRYFRTPMVKARARTVAARWRSTFSPGQRSLPLSGSL